jgi:hypothetical protein
MSDKYRLPEGRTVLKAHDVRHLCTCAKCDGVADARTAVALKGKHFELFTTSYPSGARYHTECFVEQFGEELVLLLSREEREKFRICDVSAETMRKLVGL